MKTLAIGILWCVLTGMSFGSDSDVCRAGFLAIPMMIAGTAISAIGAIGAGRAQQQQSEDAAAISEYNAQVARNQAEAEERKAGIAAEQLERKGEALLATQRTQYGRGGVLSGTGTPQVVQADTATQLEMDRQMVLAEGAEAAQFAMSQATGHMMQAKSYKSQGKYAMRGAGLSALGTGLSGLGQIGVYKSLSVGAGTSHSSIYDKSKAFITGR
ncbi:MAG: hypothetical protein GY832_11545 [Chloroflexi bacterium]|nr:hypothetical protein [Chloroflexota bacterium]